MRRFAPVALAVLFLLGFSVDSAIALTVQRTWNARIGSSGANGSVRLQAYTVGTGVLTVHLHSLRAGAAYPIQIFAGTCAKPSTVLARFYAMPATTAGTIDVLYGIPGTMMNAIWKVAHTGKIAVRAGSGTLTRCGNLTYPVATRITISKLGINLPVIRGPSGYPPCRVAMYMQQLNQPREPGVTLIYAHARTGMFLPLLSRSKINNGASLIGMRVRVYTSDTRVSVYSIIAVRRHQQSISSAWGVTAERLWLYTSEGPNFRYPKLIVIAKRLYTTTTTWAAAHPTPHPVSC
jgi:hypothetical protein